MSRRLPLPVWAGLLAAAAVLSAEGCCALALHTAGQLGRAAWLGLALGAATGLGVTVVAVLAARGMSARLRALRESAVSRLQDPSAPYLQTSTRSAGPEPAELAELAGVLEALHLRVRLGDEVGERHRRDAETAGAGVFELLSGLVAAEEGARGQLAAELHDTVAQSLMVARGLVAGDLDRSDLAKVRDYIEDAEEQVRAVMARTRPPALRDGDLASAVGNLRLDMQARYGLRVQVRWPAAPYPLPLASAVTVYRFFQEALLNVVKHADVDDAELVLAMEDDVVLASVRDEGPGFDLQAVRPDRGRHVGLSLLRERARLSGGSLEVTCGDSGGTTLTLRLPRPAAQLPAPVAPPVVLAPAAPVLPLQRQPAAEELPVSA